MRSSNVLAAAGSAGLAFFGIVILSGPLWQPGYDLFRSYGSELALGQNGWLMTVAFVVGGSGTWALAASFAMTLPPSRQRTLGVGLLAVLGGALVLSAAFPTGPHRPGPHEFIGLVGFVGVLIAMPLLSSAMSRHAALSTLARAGRYAAVAGFVVLVIILLLASPGGDAPPRPLDAYAGLLQRLFIAPWLVWLLAVAYRIARGERPSGAPDPHAVAPTVG